MYLQLLFGILMLSIFTLVFSVIVIFIFYLPFIIRSLRIKNLAKKYGLTFRSNVKFELIEPKDEDINICEGVISGKNISIFDHIEYNAFSVSPLNKDAVISSRSTIIVIDGERKQIKNYTLLGYASISSIDNVLTSLKQNVAPSEYLTSESRKNLPITYVFFIIVMIISIIIFISKHFSSQ